jgi:hypothetical protein
MAVSVRYGTTIMPVEYIDLTSRITDTEVYIYTDMRGSYDNLIFDYVVSKKTISSIIPKNSKGTAEDWIKNVEYHILNLIMVRYSNAVNSMEPTKYGNIIDFKGIIDSVIEPYILKPTEQDND